MKKKTTPKRKGAKVIRITTTLYPEKKPRDDLICHYINSLGISTSEAVFNILLECTMQHVREIAREVHGLPELRIKHLTIADLLAIQTGEWACNTNKPVVTESTCIPQKMPDYQPKKGGLSNDDEDNDFGIDDL